MFKSRQEVENRIINSSKNIATALELIDANCGKLLIVIDSCGKLCGTLTDGDIRRSLLKGESLDSPVSAAMKQNPVIAFVDMDSNERMSLMLAHNISTLPIINENKEFMGIETLHEFKNYEKLPNWAVIMCGGLGTRLGDLTRSCPKPMLRIGGVPILERIMKTLMSSGISTFFFATNYLRSQIEEYFDDGSNWNVSITYLKEEKRLGTGGALSLLPSRPEHPVLVMNGDLLTNMNFLNMIKYHQTSCAKATMGIVEFQYQNPYGVIRHANSRLLGIEEKPVSTWFINSGIYVIEPDLLDYVPDNCFLDMPNLLLQAREDGHPIGVYPIYETWLDIGRPDDYRLAEEISLGLDRNR